MDLEENEYIDDCRTNTFELCDKELKIVKKLQYDYKKEKNRNLSIPRAIRKIIREWDQLRS